VPNRASVYHTKITPKRPDSLNTSSRTTNFDLCTVDVPLTVTGVGLWPERLDPEKIEPRWRSFGNLEPNLMLISTRPTFLACRTTRLCQAKGDPSLSVLLRKCRNLEPLRTRFIPSEVLDVDARRYSCHVYLSWAWVYNTVVSYYIIVGMESNLIPSKYGRCVCNGGVACRIAPTSHVVGIQVAAELRRYASNITSLGRIVRRYCVSMLCFSVLYSEDFGHCLRGLLPDILELLTHSAVEA
jgi:hypothetical protein